MSRTKTLRDAKGWSQSEMAEFLGAHRSTVSRIEAGLIPETGPWARLLDQLEQEIAASPAPPAGAPAAEESSS